MLEEQVSLPCTANMFEEKWLFPKLLMSLVVGIVRSPTHVKRVYIYVCMPHILRRCCKSLLVGRSQRIVAVALLFVLPARTGKESYNSLQFGMLQHQLWLCTWCVCLWLDCAVSTVPEPTEASFELCARSAFCLPARQSLKRRNWLTSVQSRADVVQLVLSESIENAIHTVKREVCVCVCKSVRILLCVRLWTACTTEVQSDFATRQDRVPILRGVQM